LAVPAIPWCRAKYLERRAMRGLLPDSVLRRPKSPLMSDPAWEGMRLSGLPPLYLMSRLCEYVNIESVPKDAGADMVLFRTNFRPFALNYWLQNLRRQPRNLIQEELENGFIKRRAV
jgi:asparagine synthase (glutamine-hydrolysing)